MGVVADKFVVMEHKDGEKKMVGITVVVVEIKGVKNKMRQRRKRQCFTTSKSVRPNYM